MTIPNDNDQPTDTPAIAAVSRPRITPLSLPSTLGTTPVDNRRRRRERRFRTPRAPVPREGDVAVVYAIQAAPAGLIKFGVAADFIRRLTALRAGSPVPLVALATVPGGYDTERLILDHLTGHRSHSEWHHPADTVLAVVDAMRACQPLDYDTARAVFYGVISTTRSTTLWTEKPLDTNDIGHLSPMGTTYDDETRGLATRQTQPITQPTDEVTRARGSK